MFGVPVNASRSERAAASTHGGEKKKYLRTQSVVAPLFLEICGGYNLWW